MGIEDQLRANMVPSNQMQVGAPQPSSGLQALGGMGGMEDLYKRMQALQSAPGNQMPYGQPMQAQQGPMFQDMMARPDFMPQPRQDMMARQMDKPYDPYKQQQNPFGGPAGVQAGKISSQLHDIASQVGQFGGMGKGGGSQIGKFGGGGFGQPGAGLFGGGFGGGNAQPMWQQGPSQFQSMQRQIFKEGGEVGKHRGPEDLSGIAKHLASKGRGGDSLLLHINPQELKGIQAALKEKGYDLTYNPHTGMPEALFGGLKKLAKKAVGAVKSVAKVVTAPVKAVASAVKNTVGPIVTKVRDAVQTGLNVATFGATKSITSKGATENFNKIKDAVGPVFTKLRDIAESAAVMAGNYFVPGSSMFTSMLASKGSQNMLNSGIGQGLMALTGGLAGAGGGLSALKGGFSNLLKNGISGLGSSAMAGLKNLGTNALSGLKSLATNGVNAVKNFIANPMEGIKSLGQKGMDYLKEKVQDMGLDKATEWIGNKISGAGEVIGDGLDAAGDFLGSEAGGNLLNAAGAYFGAQAGGGGGGGGQGGGGGGGPSGPTFYNTSFKRVLNPNYGKPGEPFYLSQEFGQGEFSKQYKEPTAQDMQVTSQGLKPNDPAPVQAAPPVQAAYGGLMYADGGMTPYASGGNIYEYSAGGKLLDGPGDGMSDSIPAEIRGKKVQKALLADGEFVIPADVVSHLGNGSTKAGSKVLYSMMDRVRHARTGNPEQGKQIDANKFVPV